MGIILERCFQCELIAVSELLNSPRDVYTARLFVDTGSGATGFWLTDLDMAQFVDFISNHLLLSGMWVVSLGAIILYHKRTGSQAVGPQQAVMLINRSDAVVVDVREKKEFDSGHIVDSINIPLAKLKQRVTELTKHKEKPVVVVCKLGQHSGEAAKTLQEAGHAEVFKLAGGLTEWKAQSLPLIQK